MSIRVIIAGFKGKMGQAACQMVLADPVKRRTKRRNLGLFP